MRIRFRKAWAAVLGAGVVAYGSGVGAQAPEIYGPIKSGQTLWSVAKELKPRYPTMTLYEVIEALHVANPRAFVGDSKQLRADASLMLPKPADAWTLADRQNLPASQRSATPAPAAVASASAAPQVTATSAPSSSTPTAASASAPAAAATTAPVVETAQPNAVPPAATPSAGGAVIRASATTSSDEQTLAEVQRLREAGKPQQALEQLLPLAGRLGGDPDFDYLLGSTALDAGEYNHAVIALQRVVYQRPNDAAARLELGLSHMALRNYDRARAEFDRIEAMAPPKDVAAVIAQANAAMAQREQAESKWWRGIVRATAGFDNNVNASTSENQFLGFELDPQSQETDSPFLGGGVGLRAAVPLSGDMEFSGGVGVDHRHYPDASFVDSTLGRVDFAISKRWERIVLALANEYHYGLLDGGYNNRGAASTLTAGYTFPTVLLTGQLRRGTLRFNDAIESRDVDQLSTSVAVRWQPVPTLALGLALSIGDDEARQPGSDYSRDLTAIRGSLIWQANTDIQLQTSMGWLNADYPDPFFGFKREDDQFSIDASANWTGLLPYDWVFTPNARYVDNDSTVTLFKYDRFVVGFTASRGF